MTGFGQATGNYKNKKITIELRSLNGKTSDLRMKIPPNYKEKEIQLRNTILKKAYRGKIEGTITIDSEEGDDEFGLNKPLFKKYYAELKDLQSELQFEEGDFLTAILRIQNVIKPFNSTLDEEEGEMIIALAEEAVKALNIFREKEAVAMNNDLNYQISSIETKLNDVVPFEEGRIKNVRERMIKNLEEFKGSQKVDQNRFEQEIIFYLEKLDINEEKVRLSQHCKFFKEVLHTQEPMKGKKLGFIAQEMGREINTLGAKAQESNIQQLVVGMKDELEKIKEQVANII